MQLKTHVKRNDKNDSRNECPKGNNFMKTQISSNVYHDFSVAKAISCIVTIYLKLVEVVGTLAKEPY